MTENELVAAAQAGDRNRLEELLSSVQNRLYNLAVRMLWHPADAEDATQEILLKIAQKLDTFRGESQFSTWAWRIAVNHLLNIRKTRAEQRDISFEDHAAELDESLTDATADVEYQVATELLVEEAKIGCMQAMLLCLKREERAAYILGEIMGMTDQDGAAVFEITPAAYRKRLGRARESIRDYMNHKCGLFNPDSPCRCHKRVRSGIANGHIKPDNLLFARNGDHPELLNRIAQIDELERAGALFRTHPEYRSPTVIRDLLDAQENGP